jgi:hypothetical protein
VQAERWPSITALLCHTAEALESGRLVGLWYVEVEEGVLVWNFV